MLKIFKKKNKSEVFIDDTSVVKKKWTKQQIISLVALITLVIAHVVVLLSIALSFRYYSIYPSLFGSIVGIVICLLIVVDIIFFVGFNHQDIALKVISCVLVGFMLLGGTVGSYYIAKTNGIVNEVLDGGSQKYETYSGVFVSYSKGFQSVDELNGRKVGFLKETQNGISYIAKDILDSAKIDYATVEFNTNAELVQALIDDEVHAIAITSAYRDIYSAERDENSPFAKYLENFNDFAPFERELKTNSNRKVKNLSTDPFNVLLIGYSRTDIGSSVGLADSIIVATVNPQSYEVSMMSIARDSFVPIPCYGGEYDKINSGRSTSRACFIETVENFLGMEMDYYMELDYLGLVDIVNTIGGIEINNPVEFELDGIYVPAGKYLADGQQVLQFCRERHHMPGGDFDRQQHQKEAIIAIARKFIESGDVNLALTAMYEASQWMSTDLTLNQLTTVFNLLLNTKNFTSMETFDLVDFQTLRMTGGGGLKYYSYSMHLPLWVYLIYQGSYDESKQHINEVMGNYTVINQDRSFNFSIREKYERPALFQLSYPEVYMYEPDPMPAYWADLEGMTLEEAMAWASGNGVTLSVGEIITAGDSRYNAELEGRVCDQSIRYGSLISENKVGTVTMMGTGNVDLDDYYVPDFVGKDVSKVLDWAYEHDIEVSGTGGVESGRVVASQDPKAGTPIKDVDKIKVTLKEPEKYTVSFNSNGGSSCENITVTQGSTYGSLPSPTKTDYVFVGWFTKDGSTSGTWGSEITSSTDVTITSNITLYAKWLLDITISFDSDGGSDCSDIKAGGSLPTPTKIGYIFDGWYDGSNKITDSSKITASKELVAHWKQCTEHVWDNGIVTTMPTCTETGVLTKTCTKCGETTTESVDATGHNPVDVNPVSPTCTTDGVLAGKKCSTCGTIISGCETDTGSALGHSWGEWTETVAPTEEADGEETRTCSECGATETQPKPYSAN